MPRSRDEIGRELAGQRGLEFRSGQFYGYDTGTGSLDFRHPVSTRLANILRQQVENIERHEAEQERAAADAQASHEASVRDWVTQSTAQRTGYQQTGSGWRAGNVNVSPTGSIRGRGSFITNAERDRLSSTIEADVAAQMQMDAEQRASAFGGGGGEPEAPSGAGGPSRLLRAGGWARGRMAGAWGRGSGILAHLADGMGLMGMGAGLGSMVSTAGGVLSGGASTVANVVSSVISTSLSAAGGTGQGVATIGNALVNAAARGVAIATTGAVTLGAAVVGVLAAVISTGLAIFGAVLGAAILNVFVGALALVAGTLGKAIGDVFGELGKAVVSSLQGVVQVLQDLTKTGREFGGGLLQMMGAGGMSARGAGASLLSGIGLGMSPGQTAGMFGQWGMRPEFLGPRMSILGASPEMGREQQLMAMQGGLAGVPDFLKYPMLNIATGGNAAAMLPGMMLPPSVLAANARAREQVDPGGAAVQRFAQVVAPLLDRIAMVVAGMKLQILDRLAPLMEAGLNAILNLWTRHLGQIRSLIDRLPEFVGMGLQFMLRLAAQLLDTFGKVYDWFKGSFLPWFSGEFIPVLERFWGVLRKIGDFLGGLLGVGGGGGAGASGGGGGGFGHAGAAGAHGAGGPVRNPDGSMNWTNAGNWVGRHPWLTAGAVLAGPQLARMALPWAGTALGTAAGATIGAGAAGAAIGWGAAGYASHQTNAWRGAGANVLGIGGAAAAVAGIGAIFGGIGAIPGAAIGAVVGLFAETARLGLEVNREANRARAGNANAEAMRAGGLGALRDANGRTPREAIIAQQTAANAAYAADPMHQKLEAYKKTIADWYATVSPENMRRLVNDYMAQNNEARAKDEITVKIMPSEEFAAATEFIESERSFRSFALAVA